MFTPDGLQARKIHLQDKIDDWQREMYDLERRERGMELAESVEIISDSVAIVPSASRKKFYRVNYITKECKCEDHTFRGWICKHYYAVEYKLSWIDKRVPEVNTESEIKDTSLLLE